MTTIIVLFNLKSGVDVSAYEHWARTTDLPTVKALGSIGDFEVLRAQSLLGSEAKPAYAYVEIIRIADMARFGSDVGSEMMQRVAAEFAGFADAPQFILTEAL